MSDSINLLSFMFIGPLGLLMGYLWWNIKQLNIKLDQSLTKVEILELIDYELAPIRSEHTALKENVIEIKLKLNEIINILMAKIYDPRS